MIDIIKYTKDDILKAFHPRDRKIVEKIPDIQGLDIASTPLSWIDPSSRFGLLVIYTKDPIDNIEKLIGIVFDPPHIQMLGPIKKCDFCGIVQNSKNVSLMTTVNRVNKNRRHGMYVCTDLRCIDVICGTAGRVLPPTYDLAILNEDVQIQKYISNLEKFIEIISTAKSLL